MKGRWEIRRSGAEKFLDFWSGGFDENGPDLILASVLGSGNKLLISVYNANTSKLGYNEHDGTMEIC